MAQLCLWTKILTKQWLVLGARAFQCMRAGFLCPKCNNFACLHISQDQNKLHLNRWFFLPKSASSVSRSQAHIASVVQACIQSYSFVGRIKLIICQIRHELSVTIHQLKKKNVRWQTLYLIVFFWMPHQVIQLFNQCKYSPQLHYGIYIHMYVCMYVCVYVYLSTNATATCSSNK